MSWIRKKPLVSDVTDVEQVDEGKQQQLKTDTLWELQRKALKQLLLISATRYHKGIIMYCSQKTSKTDRGYTRRCKLLISKKNRKDRLEFTKTYRDKLQKFWDQVLWLDETKINLYQSDGKAKVWKKNMHMIPNIKAHLSNTVVIMSNLGLHGFLWDRLIILHWWCNTWRLQ